MTTNTQKQRLAALQARKDAARDRMATARAAKAEARKLGDTDAIGIAEQGFAEAHDELTTATMLQNIVLSQMNGVGGHPFGQALRSNLEAQHALAELASSSAPLNNYQHIGAVMSLEETCALTGRSLMAAPVDLGSGPDGRTGDFLGIAPHPTPPRTLLDLFASRPFTGARADYMQRQNVAVAGIQTEGAIKQESSLVYEGFEPEALTAATWTKVERQKLDDVDALLADINVALRDAVLLQVETILVEGAPASGAPGIKTSTGVLDPTITATNLADAIGQAKAQLLATGVVPNFAAANPLTIEEEESRVTTGSGEYVNTISPDGRIRRLPLVSSVALDEGEVLLGDSSLGAYLGVRQPITGAVGQESDDMVRNRATVLVEGRFAPVVPVPSAFAHFTL